MQVGTSMWLFTTLHPQGRQRLLLLTPSQSKAGSEWADLKQEHTQWRNKRHLLLGYKL